MVEIEALFVISVLTSSVPGTVNHVVEDAPETTRPKVLIVVYDDTTSFMATSFVEECERRGLSYTVALIECATRVESISAEGKIVRTLEFEPHLSFRQVENLRKVAKDFISIHADNLAGVCALHDIALLTKLPRAALRSLRSDPFFPLNRRCVLVAFSSGLDATPDWTLKNRSYADLLMANSPFHARQLKKEAPLFWPRRPKIGIGHPFFSHRASLRPLDWKGTKKIYFLHQSALPSNPLTRFSVFRFISDLAVKFPDKQFCIKLRHQPDENRENVRKEYFSPSEYFDKRPDKLRPNIQFDDRPFLETVRDADMYLSVSSSGVLEGLVSGVPSFFVDGFDGEEQDGLFHSFIDQFRDANMVIHHQKLLLGVCPKLDMQQMEEHFCSAGYFEKLLDECALLRDSPRSALNRGFVNTRAPRTFAHEAAKSLLRRAKKGFGI